MGLEDADKTRLGTFPALQQHCKTRWEDWKGPVTWRRAQQLQPLHTLQARSPAPHLTEKRAQHSQPSAVGSRGSSPDHCLRAGRGPLPSQWQKLQGDEGSIYSLLLCLQMPATHPQFPSVTTHNVLTSQPGDDRDEQTGRWMGPELAF